jgi:hypothetical protein
MALMEKYFFALSTFLVVGMADHLHRMYSHAFVNTSDVIKFALIKVSQGVVMQLGFLLDLSARSKHRV